MLPLKKTSAPLFPRAGVVIIGWVTCTLTALLCELSTMALILIQGFVTPSPRLGVLATLLILAAIFSGLLGLILLPFVVRYGQKTVPRVAVLIAIVDNSHNSAVSVHVTQPMMTTPARGNNGAEVFLRGNIFLRYQKKRERPRGLSRH